MSVPTQVIVIDSDPAAVQQLIWRLRQRGMTAASLVVPAGRPGDSDVLSRQLAASGNVNVVVVRATTTTELLTSVQQVSRILARGTASHRACLLAIDAGTPKDAKRLDELQSVGADEVIAGALYSRDVAGLVSLLNARAEQGNGVVDVGAPLQGDLAHTSSVLSLLRMLCSMHRSGVLALMKGLRRGEVRFFEGEITSAQLGFSHGQIALHQMLLWTQGRFEFRREDVVRRQQIPLTTDDLLNEAHRYLERLQASSGGLSPSERIERNHTDARFASTVPKGMNDLLRLFDGTRTLAEVLGDSPYRNFETLRVTLRAIDAGVLQRAGDSKPKPTWRAETQTEQWLVGWSNPVAVNTAVEKSAKFATWADLSPRPSSVEISPVSQVVPVSQTSGEISVPNRKSSPKVAREGLENMLDTQTRQRVFVDDLVDAELRQQELSSSPAEHRVEPVVQAPFVFSNADVSLGTSAPPPAPMRALDSIVRPLPTLAEDKAIAKAALQAAEAAVAKSQKRPSSPEVKRQSSPEIKRPQSSPAIKRPSGPISEMPKAADAVRLPDFTEDEEQFFSSGATKPHPRAETFEDLDEGYRHESFWERLWGKPRAKRKR